MSALAASMADTLDNAPAAPSISVVIPLPPSVNRIWIRTRSGIASSPKYKQWQRDAGWEIRRQRVKPLECEKYAVEIAVPLGMRKDADNIGKPCIDLFVKLGLVPDDKHVMSVSIERSPDIIPGTCRVRLCYREAA